MLSGEANLDVLISALLTHDWAYKGCGWMRDRTLNFCKGAEWKRYWRRALASRAINTSARLTTPQKSSQSANCDSSFGCWHIFHLDYSSHSSTIKSLHLKRRWKKGRKKWIRRPLLPCLSMFICKTLRNMKLLKHFTAVYVIVFLNCSWNVATFCPPRVASF